MDKSIVPKVSELQALFNSLEEDSVNWLSTNEFDDFLANLQALEALIWSTAKSPILWKWVIIAAHTALQSLAVCKLTRTDGFGAMHINTEQKVKKFYAEGKNTFANYDEFVELASEDHVAALPHLMRRLGYNVPDLNDTNVERDPILLAICLLHKFRCTYIHYPPVQLTLSTSQVRSVVRITIDIITMEIEKGDWKRRPLITLDDVKPLLKSINTGLLGREGE